MLNQTSLSERNWEVQNNFTLQVREWIDVMRVGAVSFSHHTCVHIAHQVMIWLRGIAFESWAICVKACKCGGHEILPQELENMRAPAKNPWLKIPLPRSTGALRSDELLPRSKNAVPTTRVCIFSTQLSNQFPNYQRSRTPPNTFCEIRVALKTTFLIWINGNPKR